MTYIEMGNGSDNLLESIECTVLSKLGLDFCGRGYSTNLITYEDTSSHFDGLLSVLKDGYDVIAQASIKARRPFSHAVVSISDYR